MQKINKVNKKVNDSVESYVGYCVCTCGCTTSCGCEPGRGYESRTYNNSYDRDQPRNSTMSLN